jgi:glycosyltransferase involved in cell wall biosynthesis
MATILTGGSSRGAAQLTSSLVVVLSASMVGVRVGVVIAAYEPVVPYLVEAVTSARDQTSPPAVIVVVDDGSPTPVDPADVPDAVVVRTANAGTCAARNAGAAAAGDVDLLCFLDQDDRLLPHALATGVAALDGAGSAEWCAGLAHHIDAAGRIIGPPFDRRRRGRSSVERLLRRAWILPPSVVLVRADAFAAMGGFTPGIRFVGDLDFFLRLARRGDGVEHLKIVAEYRMHAGNGEGGRFEDNHQRLFDFLEAQRAWTAADPRWERARRDGVRFWHREHDRVLQMRRMQTSVDEGGLGRRRSRQRRVPAPPPVGLAPDGQRVGAPPRPAGAVTSRRFASPAGAPYAARTGPGGGQDEDRGDLRCGPRT